MGYTKNVLTGFSWLTALKVFTKALTFIKIVILARILSPRDFGVFGLVTVVLSLVEVFSETGINPFLIQTEKNPKTYVNTAWVISIFRGVGIACILGMLALVLPMFYKEPSMFGLLLIAMFIPIIKGFINPSIVFFQRKLEFHKDVYVRVVLVGVEVVASVVLAVLLRSPLALILAQIITVTVEVIITHMWVRPTPQFVFHTKLFKEIIKFGKWLNISGLLAFLGGNVDDLIIGKLLGTTTLGYYQTAFNVAQTSVGEVGDLGAQATFPVFSKMSTDKKRLRRAFFRSLLPLAFVLTIPVLILLKFDRPLVLLVFGEKWLPILPALPWLVGAAYLQGLNAIMYPLHIATKHIAYNVLILAVYLVVMVGLLVPLTQHWGLAGTGIALFLARLVLQPLFMYTVASSLKE